MRRLRKAMRSEGNSVAATDKNQPIQPRTSQLLGVRRRRRSSAIKAEFGRSAKTARSKKPGRPGADASSFRRPFWQRPSKDDSDDASGGSSSGHGGGHGVRRERVVRSHGVLQHNCAPFFCYSSGWCGGLGRVPGQRPFAWGPSTGSQTQQCAHKTRCGAACTCEPASMSCQDTRILSGQRHAAARRLPYGSTARPGAKRRRSLRLECQRRPVAAPPARLTLPAPTIEPLEKQPSHPLQIARCLRPRPAA